MEHSCAGFFNRSQNLQLRAAKQKPVSGRTEWTEHGMKCLHHTEAEHELTDGYDRINNVANEAF